MDECHNDECQSVIMLNAIMLSVDLLHVLLRVFVRGKFIGLKTK
jgi:hypothetical protein